MQVNVIKPDTVLVNWTLAQHLLQLQLQLQIVYNPVQANYYIVHPVLNPATEFVYLENLQPYTSYQLVMRTANLSSVFLHTDTNYFSTSGRITPGLESDKNITGLSVEKLIFPHSLLKIKENLEIICCPAAVLQCCTTYYVLYYPFLKNLTLFFSNFTTENYQQ